MYNFTLIFLYGLILSVFLSLIGMYLIPRGLAFLADILGHAYLGAYIVLSVIYSKIGELASILIATLMSREALKEDVKSRGVNVMIYYIFFTVLLLGVVSVFKPDALNMIIFGNILSVNEYKFAYLLIAVIFWVFMAIKFRKEILLSMLNKEFSLSVYENVNVKEFWFVFFSLIILMHAISVFGILLTAAITLLPYLTASIYTKGLKDGIFLSIVFSVVSYLISYYISLHYDISISVAFSSISLVFYIFSYLFKALFINPANKG